MNPRKPDGQRMRDCMIGVSFPPARKAELKAAADANGLTMSAWSRMTIMNRLDEIKRERKKSSRTA